MSNSSVSQSHYIQAIIWTNVDPDPCQQMASLGHDDLMWIRKSTDCDHCSDWVTETEYQSEVEHTKDTPIARPNGRAMGCLCEDF